MITHRPPRRWLPLAAVAALLVLIVAVLAGYAARTALAPDRPDAAAAAGASESPGGPATPVSGLPTIEAADLPSQARTTLTLVDQGGPFPYQRDGIVFGNNEGLLPPAPRGYYREYTVPTPGSADRGARRLVVGADGDVYYTEDHYDSFRQVTR